MRIISDCDLEEFNSYRIKARCKRAFFPETQEEIVNIFLLYPDQNKIILGNGNNHILAKDFYEDDFIIFNGNFNRIKVNGNEIYCQAGATLAELSETALEHQLTGCETFWDIPSSIGGAVVMNAGASGDEVKDILTSATYLDMHQLVVKSIENSAIGFEYRNSFFQQNSQYLVLSANFRLTEGRYEVIKARMEETKENRWAKQPREYPNCGSVFKRPKGRYVGPMLDELNLKGYTVGGAQVSTKHSGFIINTGGATGQDILKLIEDIREKVFRYFKVELEVEQRII